MQVHLLCRCSGKMMHRNNWFIIITVVVVVVVVVVVIIIKNPIAPLKKKGIVLYINALNTFYFTVIWCQTYDKRPLRYRQSKPAAATWTTLSDEQQGGLLFAPFHRPDSTYHSLCDVVLSTITPN